MFNGYGAINCTQRIALFFKELINESTPPHFCAYLNRVNKPARVGQILVLSYYILELVITDKQATVNIWELMRRLEIPL
jgi:hypothetical protein